MMARS